MKTWLKIFLSGLTLVGLNLPLRAQTQQPVVAVSVTAPANESSGVYTSSVTLTAIPVGVSPAGGYTITFFINGTSVGASVTTPPSGSAASISWTPPQPGSYFVSATAAGASVTATSLPIRYFATGTVVNSPVSGTLVPAGSSVVLKADATGAAGFVKQIQFFDGATSIGTDTTAPYSLIYAPSGAGVHSITAQATDNNGSLLTASAAITLNVITAITPLPTVSISSPQNNSTVAIPSSSMTVSVNANSTSGFITKTELYIDGVLFGTDNTFPYSFSWLPTVVGSYNLVALGYDDKNNVVASTTNTVRVAAPPTVAVSQPTASSTVTGGSPIQLSAIATTASSGATISSVQFFVDSTFVGQATTAASGNTYTVTATLTQKKDTSGTPIASVITALGVDSNGLSTTSTGVSVTVTSGGSGAAVVIGIAPTVSVTAPTASSTLSVNTPVNLSANASDSDGNITSVDFIVNSLTVGTDTTYPYTSSWTPTSLGTYTITAKATDDKGNQVTSSGVSVTVSDPSPSAPTVAITSPATGSSMVVNSTRTIVASATDDVAVASVQFFVNGQPLGAADTVFPFQTDWTPTSPGQYTLTARAIDNVGNAATSAQVVATVTGNAAPTVAITSPVAGASIIANNTTSIIATAADSDGTAASVEFFVNGVSLAAPITAFPFRTEWTPKTPGTYVLTARAVDNAGSVTISAAVSVTVAGSAAPTVAISSPTTGSTLLVGSSTTVTATASDSDGTIASVDFFANGTLLASLTSPSPQGGYRTGFSPASEGIYRLTAVATDNSGVKTTSSEVNILSVSTSSAAATTVYTGSYSGVAGGIEFGRFALVTVGTTTATFMGYSTTTPLKTYFYTGGTVDSNGGVSFAATSGQGAMSGTAIGSGISGTFDGTRLTFIGQQGFSSSTAVASGYFQGNLSGRNGSRIVGIVGVDGTIYVYGTDGTFSDVGSGTVASNGSFTVTTAAANVFKGTVNPSTGLMTGSITGAMSASFTGALATGGTYSDGVLKGLSTRGFVGTGANVMIAGFVVNGTVAKQIIVRGIGPSLAAAGVSGVLANPKIDLFNSSGAAVSGGSNDNWSDTPANRALMSTVGLGAPGSTLESFAVANLAPGVYTAQLSGVSNGTGVGLVEIYDTDTVSAFSTQKVTAISTRGFVNTGDGSLIAGFIVNGTSPKKVLIEAVGPSLSGVAGLLADPVLQIIRNGVVIRENDNWEVGNDRSLVLDAAARSGATALAAGGKDAAILINLQPGTYTAVASGAGGSTGIALINVYEVP